jgi:hypothetical protein
MSRKRYFPAKTDQTNKLFPAKTLISLSNDDLPDMSKTALESTRIFFQSGSQRDSAATSASSSGVLLTILIMYD